ncbi:Saccharopine dehydrogenase [Tuber magnatum]|uniref:Saccharopine dehydrogenase [NADP(+), L-glutamate-forming] n=1 Tax=Tuber magnatum TaxID=42249 RepID=A0A317SSE2_9PEZI|nr:Saccharopine dehydrogenase [Tuber magnatum]
MMASILGSHSSKVLLLGSGFVAKPCLNVLSDSGVAVTVACRTLRAAEELVKGVKHASAISLDVNNTGILEAEVAKHDLVISLIPYTYHAQVIKAAIKKRRNVVTTSYVSPAMMELDQAAKDAGITVMNEIGLDPGIDHLYAIKTIGDVHSKGGKILSFLSYCGGLPAPEASGNPLGYKFSWSSRGVLLALRNTAKYYKDGKVEEIDGSRLMEAAKPYLIYPGFAFVAYPNRDSTTYRERYAIPEAQTIIRGTLRYQGFPEFVRTLVDTGFLSDEPLAFLKPSDNPLPWKTALAKILGSSSEKEEDLIWAISSKSKFRNNEEKERIINGMRWLGMFSEAKIIPRGNPLDTLCATLEERMQYGPGERDMVMLQHRFDIEFSDGCKETRTSTLVEYGEKVGYTAMARLVGIPCAVATKLVLNGTISDRGVLAPVTARLCDPLRKELKDAHGIECIEETVI